MLRASWLAPGAHVNAVGSSIPTTRELDSETVAAAPLFVDRRESTENEVGRLPDRPARGRDRPGPHPRRARRGAGRRRPGRTSDAELTVFKSLGLAVEDLAAAAARRRAGARERRGHEVAVLIPLDEIRAARETIAGTAIRTPLVRLNTPEAPAEIYLKLENLQPIGSFKLRGAYNAVRNASQR